MPSQSATLKGYIDRVFSYGLAYAKTNDKISALGKSLDEYKAHKAPLETIENRKEQIKGALSINAK